MKNELCKKQDELLPELSFKRFFFRHAIRDFWVDGEIALWFLPTVVVYCNSTLRSFSRISQDMDDMFHFFVIPVFVMILIVDILIQGIVLSIFNKDCEKLSEAERAQLWNGKTPAICVGRYYITRNVTIYLENFEKKVIFDGKTNLKGLYAYRRSLSDVVDAMLAMEMGRPITKKMVDAVQQYENRYYSDEITLTFVIYMLQYRFLFVASEIDLYFRLGVLGVLFIWLWLKYKIFPARRSMISKVIYYAYLAMISYFLFICQI